VSTKRGIGIALVCCAAAGVISVAATIAHNPAAGVVATEEYGRRLIGQTAEILGPDAADPKMRYIKSRLACGSCHLGTGSEAGTLSLVTAIRRYPRISPRVGGNETIQDRINGCMMRSMNGRALPENSREMIAMVAYLQSLADRDAAMGASSRAAHEPLGLKTPNRAANPAAGEPIFQKRCAGCHGGDGDGLASVIPPLWGPNSFNDGAGLHRVIISARFIKAKMPLGRPDLSDDEAYDVAAFINSKDRPAMAGLERDYPDPTKKPVDTPYPPYADSFAIGQHRYGPFAPIEAYYQGARK